ncbi:MAG: ADOP family duplicated permease [Actinomycetota bacterium]
MRWLSKISHRLRSIFAKAKAESELSTELQFHLEQQIEQNIADGMSPEQARFAALRDLGGLAQVEEQCRDSRGVNWLEHALQDLRFALRTWRRNPGFTLLLVLTLALGIGANTAIFSLVNGILLRPLPFPHPEQLVNAAYTGPVPEGALLGFQQRVKSLEVAAHSWSGFNMMAGGNAVRINGSTVSSNWFSLLGVNAFKGRVFRKGDELPGQDNLAIISYSLWQTRFAADPNIVGKWITIDNTVRQIVGVMPRDFTFPAPSVQLWLPVPLDAQHMWGDFLYWMIGRIKPGVSLEQARAEFKAAAPQVEAQYPWTMGKDYVSMFNIGPFQHDAVGRLRPTLLLLLGATGLILLVACVNVANLLLAKTATREREIAIRTALGASRRRIIRQLLTESTLFAASGGVVGILLAWTSLSAVKAFVPAYTPGLASVQIDLRVMAFSLLLALVTGVMFGMAPALHATVPDVEQSLKSGTQNASLSRKRNRLASVLVIAEVAMAVVLVIGAGLLIKSLYVMLESGTGVETDHLLTAELTPSADFCRKHNQCIDFYSQVVQQVRALPGVRSAAVGDGIPLYFVGRTVIAVEGRAEYSAQRPYSSWEFSVSPDYIPTMGISILRGRNFTAADGPHSAKVVLVEKALADLFWPGADPIGKHIKPSWMKDWRTVVGVVQDVRKQNVVSDDVAARMVGAVYFPEAQGIISPPGEMDLVVRTLGDPAVVARELPQAVASIDRTVPATKIRTMDEVIQLSVQQPRSTMWVFTAFAGLGMLLGMVGIYGIVSHSVVQRTREIGIRIAMGAERSDVLRMVLRDSSYLILLGLTIGIAGAMAITRLMGSILHGVQPNDAATFIVVSILVGSAGILASMVPSRRASKIDPIIALKSE